MDVDDKTKKLFDLKLIYTINNYIILRIKIFFCITL